MVLTKIQFSSEHNKKYIVSENDFIINSLYPIGFKETSVENNFMFLFGAYQDFEDKYIYLQILFKIEDPFEYNIIKEHHNYIPNYEGNPDQASAYQHMISEMNDDNLYATDFIMSKSDRPFYYSAIAVKKDDATHARLLHLYIPRNTFIRIKIFLENLDVRGSVFPCSIFANPAFNNPKFVDVDELKRCETCEAATKEKFVDTHYEMICGPDLYKMNYRSYKHPTYKLANELDQNIFNSQYSTNYYLQYIIRDETEDMLYVIHCGEKLRYEKDIIEPTGSIVVLKLDNRFIDRTNFLNQFNKIYICEENK